MPSCPCLPCLSTPRATLLTTTPCLLAASLPLPASLPRLQDPPEYFQHPQGYIAYDDTVPPALLEAARAVTRNFSLEATGPHFDLVNAQLKQLRVAFALAQVGAGCWVLGLGDGRRGGCAARMASHSLAVRSSSSCSASRLPPPAPFFLLLPPPASHLAPCSPA